jgi:DDE superfamily endonuclease
MDDGKQLWSIWQRLLMWFDAIFTRPGWVRFVQWMSGTVLCDEQHTITQEVTSLGLMDQWRNWENFAEYGAIDERAVEEMTMRLVEQEHPCRFGGYHPVAVDDTKELRSSDKAWGVCTFKHVSSRNPKHPKLVKAHNWVIMGDLAPGNGREPWTYLPTASRLYMRERQLPAGEAFRTKNELAAQMLRQLDQASQAPVLGIFDGGYARAKVVQPCLASPKPDGKTGNPRRIEILTRPRSDARLYKPLMPQSAAQAMRKAKPKSKRGGRRRIWGERLPSPKHHAKWNVPWKEGQAWAYGQLRKFRYKSLDCRWAVSGPDAAVRAFIFEVERYSKPWYIVTSAPDLSAEQVLEAYAARFRQEDAIRDHKQRLGMEEVRAWTKAPVLRTFMVQQLCMTLMRLLQWEWEQRRGSDWCPAPPWNKHKTRVSILDLRRLLWRHRKAFSHFMKEMDGVEKKRRGAA